MALPALLAQYINFGNGSSTGYYAVTAWPSLTAVAAGVLCRQLAAPTVGNERVFVCIIPGTTLVSEPSWTVTRGAKTAEAAGPTWQECTGQPATNGDLTNTYTWSASKTAASTPSLGVIVKDASNNLYIVSTSGAVGASEPTWDTTVGNTTTDSAAVWTCIANGVYGAWAAPHNRLANAFASTWGAAGDTFYVAGAHAETQAASMTLTSPGTAASPCRLLCVNAAGSVPPVSADLQTSATVTATTDNKSMAFAGHAWSFGIHYVLGSGASNGNTIQFVSSSAWWWSINSGSLVLAGSGNNRITIGGGSNPDEQLLELTSTTLGFSEANHGVQLRTKLRWKNTASAITGTVPTTLFLTHANNDGGYCECIGVDLSAAGSGKNLVDAAGSWTIYKFLDCKLGASVSITTNSVGGQGGVNVDLINCDSADTNYRYYRQMYQGTITQETTIVRTGGASDGTTTFSRKMVSTANSKWYSPLESDPMLLWNETIGSSVTVTIPVITDNVTLTDAEAWIEVEYLGTSGFPLGGYASDRSADVLATAANQTTDGTSTWTTTGLSTPVKQSLSKSFTPQEKGPCRVRVMLAKASTTMYYDPKIQVS